MGKLAFRRWLAEMAASVNFMGDWEGAHDRVRRGEVEEVPDTTDPQGRSVKGVAGWPSSSIRGLRDPAGQDKIVQAYRGVPENFVFNFVMWRSPDPSRHGYAGYFRQGEGDDKYGNIGSFSEEQLHDILGPELASKAVVHPDKLNVFFLNNIGSSNIRMTSWITAHRFAHTIASDEEEEGVNKALERAANLYYHGYRKFVSDDELATILARKLFTFASARNGQLRDRETQVEVVAQYILTRQVPLNDPPEELVVPTAPPDQPGPRQSTLELGMYSGPNLKAEIQKAVEWQCRDAQQKLDRMAGGIFIV